MQQPKVENNLDDDKSTIIDSASSENDETEKISTLGIINCHICVASKYLLSKSYKCEYFKWTVSIN